MKVNQSDFAVVIFDQRGATFHPVTTVQILNTINVLDLRAMNVTANDAIGLLVARHRS